MAPRRDHFSNPLLSPHPYIPRCTECNDRGVIEYQIQDELIIQFCTCEEGLLAVQSFEEAVKEQREWET